MHSAVALIVVAGITLFWLAVAFFDSRRPFDPATDSPDDRPCRFYTESPPIALILLLGAAIAVILPGAISWDMLYLWIGYATLFWAVVLIGLVSWVRTSGR